MQNRHLIPDERALSLAADVLGSNPLQLFGLAYQEWYGRPIRERDLAHAFDRYLFAGEVPCWVRAFTRHTLALCEEVGMEVALNQQGHNVTTIVASVQRRPGVSGLLWGLIQLTGLWSLIR